MSISPALRERVIFDAHRGTVFIRNVPKAKRTPPNQGLAGDRLAGLVALGRVVDLNSTRGLRFAMTAGPGLPSDRLLHGVPECNSGQRDRGREKLDSRWDCGPGSSVVARASLMTTTRGGCSGIGLRKWTPCDMGILMAHQYSGLMAGRRHGHATGFRVAWTGGRLDPLWSVCYTSAW